MAEERRIVKIPHNIIMEDRKSLTVSGVSDVDSFDEQTVIVYTDMGELTVRGTNLHISRLNTETGELNMNGNICALFYSDERATSGGFFSRLFK